VIRFFAILFRKFKEYQGALKLVKKYSAAMETNATIQLPNSKKQKDHEYSIALIRLDDIGDYVLFRNALPIYEKYARSVGATLTLIGNEVWKPIFEHFDESFCSSTIWINKSSFLNDINYKTEILQLISNREFDEIIALSRTRPLLIDDIIVSVTNSNKKIAVNNSLNFGFLNELSDKHYTQLIPQNNFPDNEGYFNIKLAELISGSKLEDSKPLTFPVIPHQNSEKSPYICCFIGASAKSKRWPTKYWITLINACIKNGINVLIAGGKGEKAISERIVLSTGCKSIVGKATLIESISYLQNAYCIISGDTFAAHIGALSDVKTIIISNGVNAYRFGNYNKSIGFENTQIVFSKYYNKSKKHTAVTADLKSITPYDILKLI
jgi:ADP-heptose:LPS heptosyltransferase